MTDTTPATRTPEHEVDPVTGLRAGTFAVATLADGPRAFPALVTADGAVTDLSDRYRDLHDVFDDWATNLQQIGDLAADDSRPTRPLDGLRPLPP